MRYPFDGWHKDQQGKVVSGGTVAVTLTGTTTAATVYQESTGSAEYTGGIITTNTTDNIGYFKGWVDTDDYSSNFNQRFRLTFTKENFKTLTLDDEIIFPHLMWRYFADAAETDQGLAGNGRTLKSYIDSITGGNGDTIVLVPGTYTFSTDETVPSDVSLLIQEGATISVDTGVTLTINGNILLQGKYQIFSLTGTGKVKFGTTVGGRISEVHPVWWDKDVADGTDKTSVIQSAIDSLPDMGFGGPATSGDPAPHIIIPPSVNWDDTAIVWPTDEYNQYIWDYSGNKSGESRGAIGVYMRNKRGPLIGGQINEFILKAPYHPAYVLQCQDRGVDIKKTFLFRDAEGVGSWRVQDIEGSGGRKLKLKSGLSEKELDLSSVTTKTITDIVQIGSTREFTFTTSTTHGYSVGDKVSHTGTTNFNGEYIIRTVPTTTTYTSYSNNNSDETSITATVALNFENGETITGGTSTETATVVRDAYRAGSFIAIESASGAFTAGETITGGTTGQTAVVLKDAHAVNIADTEIYGSGGMAMWVADDSEGETQGLSMAEPQNGYTIFNFRSDGSFATKNLSNTTLFDMDTSGNLDVTGIVRAIGGSQHGSDESVSYSRTISCTANVTTDFFVIACKDATFSGIVNVVARSTAERSVHAYHVSSSTGTQNVTEIGTGINDTGTVGLSVTRSGDNLTFKATQASFVTGPHITILVHGTGTRDAITITDS